MPFIAPPTIPFNEDVMAPSDPLILSIPPPSILPMNEVSLPPSLDTVLPVGDEGTNVFTDAAAAGETVVSPMASVFVAVVCALSLIPSRKPGEATPRPSFNILSLVNHRSSVS